MKIKVVSFTLSFRISPLLFKIQNRLDSQLDHSDRALQSACPVFPAERLFQPDKCPHPPGHPVAAVGKKLLTLAVGAVPAAVDLRNA